MRFARHALLIGALPLLFVTSGRAQEYFGDFLDRLKGIFITEGKPRPTFKLDTEFRFKDPNGLMWTTPLGTEVDGASIPQPFWSVIGGPFEGQYINASVIHDHYCRTKERTAHDTHRNFYYGMRASNVPEWKAKLMHWAVATYGPDWKLEKRIVMKQTCIAEKCTAAPATIYAMTSGPAVDLSDPDVLAAAISKTNAIARTLLTSNGETLDVTAFGSVPASLESVEKNAAMYRQVFVSKEFTSSPSRLGVLSQQAGAGSGVVQPWAGNRIPRYNETPVLTPSTAPRIAENEPYKVDSRSKDLIKERFDPKSMESSVILRPRG